MRVSEDCNGECQSAWDYQKCMMRVFAMESARAHDIDRGV